jgi:hypothetical protein
MRGAAADAVVEISEFAESCEYAIKSIVRNKARFCAVHIVHSGATPMYEGWEADQRALDPLPLVWHNMTLDPARLHSEVAVHVPPDVQALEAAFQELADATDNPHTRDTEFGVSSVLYFEDRLGWASLLALGFLPVLLLLDTFRYVFNMRRYHRTSDLRANFVVRTHPRRVYVAPTRWYLWEAFTQVHRSIYGGAACMQMVGGGNAPGVSNGVSFLLRTLKTHRHMGWRTLVFWWLPFVLYYATFALPWWMLFVDGQYRGYFAAFIVRNVMHPGWITMYTAHATVGAALAWIYIRYPQPWMWAVHALLFPVYFTLSPILYVYARFHVSHAAWQRAKSE